MLVIPFVLKSGQLVRGRIFFAVKLAEKPGPSRGLVRTKVRGLPNCCGHLSGCTGCVNSLLRTSLF